MGPAWSDDGLVIMEGYPRVRWDRWFEIHPMDVNDPSLGAVDIPGYWEWIEKVTQDETKRFYFRPPIYKGIQGYEIPFDGIVETHSPYFCDSTVSYMMGFALMEEFFPNLEEIGLYGIDFATETERRLQKKGTYYFIQLCKLRGIKVHIPPESDMYFQPLPYPEDDPLLKKYKAQGAIMMDKRIRGESNLKTLKEHVRLQEIELVKIDGGFDILEYFEGNRE